MMKNLFPVPLMLVSLACGAPDENVTVSHDAVTAYNGTTYNGISFGGLSLWSTKSNTTMLSGLYSTNTGSPELSGSLIDTVSGIGPNGTSFDGKFEDLCVDGSGFDGGLSGSDLVGQVFKAKLENGSKVGLHVAGVTTGAGSNADLLYYQVGISDGADWSPLCGVDVEGAPRKAIAVPGAWNTTVGEGGGDWRADEGEFTFACAGSSIAKCVELGYRQDLTGFTGRPEALLACVRMMRADYCGDGRTHTQNGTLIEVWDRKRINAQENPNWTVEAGWTSRGASCLQSARHEMPTCAHQPASDCSKWYVLWTLKTSFPSGPASSEATSPSTETSSEEGVPPAGDDDDDDSDSDSD